MRTVRRVAASALVVSAASALAVAANTGTAAAYDFNSVTVTCHSENPFPWLPAFEYVLNASTGYGSENQGTYRPKLMVNGLPDNRAIEVAPFLTPFSVDYSVSTTVAWHNTTTGQSGATTHEQSFRLPNAGTVVEPGAGHVEFTATQTTGAVFTAVNPKVSVCSGAIDVAPV